MSTSLTGDVAEILKVILIAVIGIVAVTYLKGVIDGLSPKSAPSSGDEPSPDSPLFFGPFKSPTLNAANVLAGPEDQIAEMDDLIAWVQKKFSGESTPATPTSQSSNGTDSSSYAPVDMSNFSNPSNWEPITF